MKDDDSKVWRGTTLEQRSHARRERLLEAGLEIFGTTGYATSTVSGICSAANVSTRTFYELFGERADLIEAIYLRVIEDIRARIEQLPAPTAVGVDQWTKDAVRAVVGPLLADLRVCQVIEIEVVGLSPHLEELRRVSTLAIAQTLESVQVALSGEAMSSPAVRQQVGVFIVGGITETLVAYMRTPASERQPPDELLDMVTAVILRVLVG